MIDFQDFTKKWSVSSHRRIVASSHRRIVAVPCFSDRIPESIGFGFWFFWAFLFVWTARQLLRVSIHTIYYPGSSSTRSSSRSTNLVRSESVVSTVLVRSSMKETWRYNVTRQRENKNWQKLARWNIQLYGNEWNVAAKNAWILRVRAPSDETVRTRAF